MAASGPGLMGGDADGLLPCVRHGEAWACSWSTARRAARQVAIPLWADHHLGLTAATASVIYGIAGAIDLGAVLPGRQAPLDH